MTDLTDAHFLNNIRQNPDDELAQGIYADWLEEQGDLKSNLIRLFQQAVAGGEDEHEDLLDALRIHLSDGGVSTLVTRLSDPQCRMAVVDLIWKYGRLTPLVREFLFDLWAYSTHGDMRRDFWEYERLFGGEGVSMYSTEGLCYVATSYYGDTALDAVISGLHGALGYQKSFRDYCELLLASYYLFGTNVLPEGYAQTGLSTDV